ncbi:MAG TPA: hypothetical protein VG815_02340 [Chloroflexota bacterium]|jgi:hypothetical protein|nr:hypothetical protein [Chloroflexota bacterium]
MRGSYRGNDKTLRWALVGGIVLVVLIATALAIFGLGTGKKNASPTPTPVTPGGGSACLSPAGMTVETQPIVAAALKPVVVNPIAAKGRLAATEILLARRGASLITISPTGKRFLFAKSGGGLWIGKIHVPKGLRLNVSYEDAAFNSGGAKIILQKSARFSAHPCATLVLETIGLTGKKKHLLFAGQFALANAPSGSGANAATLGTLQQDVLGNGWIVLVARDHLYAFDPTKHRVGPLEAKALGPIYQTGGTNQLPSVQFNVSPNGRYVAVAPTGGTGGTTAVTVRALPAYRVLPFQLQTVGAVSWSRSGDRMAYVTEPQAASVNPVQVIKTLDLKTSKQYTIHVNMKKYGSVSIANIRWSKGDAYIAFTATPLSGTSNRPLVFIGPWKGKHVQLLNPSALKSKKKA